MTLRIGGAIPGVTLLVTILVPLGYGTSDADTAGVMAFGDARPGVLIAWKSGFCRINALALAMLAPFVASGLKPATTGWAAVTRGLGPIWAAVVLGVGMIANAAVEQVAQLYAIAPGAAAELWTVLHAVEPGLGGGNEIAGGT